MEEFPRGDEEEHTLILGKTNQVSFSDMDHSQSASSNNILRLLYVGVVLLIYASTLNSGLNMVSQIFDQIDLNSLGQINLLLIYIFAAIGNIFAPTLVRKGSYRSVLFISSFGYLTFLFCGALTCFCELRADHALCTKSSLYAFNIICSIICGFLASIFWIAENSYISSLATNATKGLYFGLAWALIQSSQLVGNLIAVLLLYNWSHLTYFTVLTALCCTSAFGFLCIWLPDSKDKSALEKSEEVKAFEKNSFNQKLQVYFNCIREPRIRPLLFYMVSSGLILAFFSGFLYEVIQSTLEKDLRKETINEKTSMVFIALGIMEIIGGLLVSKIADSYNKVTLCMITTVSFILALIFTFLADYNKNYYLCFFCAGLFGFADCTTQAMITTVIGSHFAGTVEHYAIFNQFQYIGALAGMTLILALNSAPRVWFISLVAVYQILTLYQQFQCLIFIFKDV